jgi:hypothetical protein
VSINNQLAQENNGKMLKITELEQVLAQEQQYVSFSRTKLPNSFCF